ncbi:hypothetical protein EDC04DRAFT_2588644 [Pisolithus marmoratus]|nr:hypothetical protein EDC04DRAFT_2588644 [Pisolithus marmoratus]
MHLPPVTLHYVFPRERDESPPLPETVITLQRVFHPDQSAIDQSSCVDPCYPPTSNCGRPSPDQSPLSASEPLTSPPHSDDLPTNETQPRSQGKSIALLLSNARPDRKACKGNPTHGPGRSLIPAPPGTLSKPGMGGYTLRSALGWEDKKYKSVQKALHEIAKRVFDMSLPMHKQTSAAVNSFCRKAAEQFPFLNEYENYWPARDFATMYLKNRPKTGREVA